MNDVVLVITGASGFLGRQLTRDAMRRGATVRPLSRRGWTPDHSVQGIACDVLDPDGLRSAMRGATHVVHAAGLAHVFDKANSARVQFQMVNSIGTENVLRAAVAAGVQRVVHVSSVSVYGPHGHADCTEESPCHPVGPYASSKLEAELRAQVAVESSGSALTILRLATLYGEEDPGNVARLMRAIDRGRFIWIGDGSTRKSLIHRDDASRACLLAVSGALPSNVSVFNVSSPPVTMRQVVNGLAEALDRRVPPVHLSGLLIAGLTRFASDKLRIPRAESLHDTVQKWLSDDVYDGSPFNSTCDFRTEVSLEAGLAREVEWYRTSQPEVMP